MLNLLCLVVVQLHGDGSRAAFPALVKENRIIYVLHVKENRDLLNQISDEECSLADWVLVDSACKGWQVMRSFLQFLSLNFIFGKGFNWAQFTLPPIRSKHGWLLAGGINPGSVCEALSILKPNGVDVSSGICASDGIQKDQSQISSFMSAVRSVHY
ncbi:hypothetical protein Q3G72_004828 [Acer saccharum]|nr:hypothetical protein Q3G72_004828 [Acer saccharum]